MTILEYIKKYGNLDQVVVLLKESGFKDEEIIKLTGVSKQTIYDMRRKFEALLQNKK